MSPSWQVTKSALRTIGNIVCAECSDDNNHGASTTTDYTEVILYSGLVPCLMKLVTHCDPEIRKEAIWTLSKTNGLVMQFNSGAPLVPIVPLGTSGYRIEVGDVEKAQVRLAIRHSGEKIDVPIDRLFETIQTKLEEIQKAMFTKAKEARDDHVVRVTEWESTSSNASNTTVASEESEDSASEFYDDEESTSSNGSNTTTTAEETEDCASEFYDDEEESIGDDSSPNSVGEKQFATYADVAKRGIS